MAKTPKRPRDANQLAKLVIDMATGNAPEEAISASGARASKAGAIGGPARAKALTPAQRSEIATIAASARWKKS